MALLRKPSSAFLLALVVAVAACAPRPPAPAPVLDLGGISRHAATETFAAGYSSIFEKYIEPVALETVAIAGMRGLGSIDPAISVVREPGALRLTSSNRLVARFDLPADGDANRWAALTTDVFAASRAASDALRASTVEEVYQVVFDGALKDLDAYSRYAGTEEARRNRAKRVGFGGIGIRFRVKAGVVRITGVVPKTPAAGAGLRTHDRITHVGEVALEGMSKTEVLDRIRGPVKTTVTLRLRRPGRAKPWRVRLERRHIVPRTVTARHRDGIVMVRISGFNQNTARSLGTKLESMERELGGAMKGVVLDLRGNPGGLLKQSVRVADLFLAQGDIVNTRGRHPDSLQHYEADGSDFAHGQPMAVLVDGKSASAAEIVAAALQDRRRAVVIGTASFGKGTVQTVIRLPNEGEITLTWSRLVAPSGYVLHGLGVLPVICTSGVAADDGDPIDATLARRQETSVAHAAWRAAGLHDEDGRRALRAACPAERHRDVFDLEVARTLITDRAVYGRVLDLLRTTAAAEN